MAKSNQQKAIEAAAGEKIKRSISTRILQLILWTAAALAAISMIITIVMFYTEFMDVSREGASATGSLLKYVVIYLVMMALATLVIAYFMKQYAKEHIVDPIDKIADAATGYILDKSDGTLDDMTHFSNLHLDTNDELEHLALVLRDMEVSMVHYVDNLTKITREKERISTELDLAKQIQENMLPSVFPPYPDRHDLDIHASMDPAKAVGGDFYDFFLIDEEHLGMVMADVSGKGIPAALFMMMARIMINYSAKTGIPPSEVLRQVNERICENNDAEMFVTVWLGILNLTTGEVTAANAGHEYPMLRGAKGDFVIKKDPHGFVVGGMEGVRYRDYTFTLERGGTLFLYTDGLPEANDKNGKLFGTDRILEVLNRDPKASAEQLLDSMTAAVAEYVGKTEQFDDLTMMAVRLLDLPKPAEGAQNVVEKEKKNHKN